LRSVDDGLPRATSHRKLPGNNAPDSDLELIADVDTCGEVYRKEAGKILTRSGRNRQIGDAASNCALNGVAVTFAKV
jgi:hypothetical protein